MSLRFRHKGLRLLYEKGDRSGIRPDITEKVQRFLTALDQAEAAEDVNLPGYSLHALRGNMKGWWSASVTRNHRIIFRFGDEGVEGIDLVDYH